MKTRKIRGGYFGTNTQKQIDWLKSILTEFEVEYKKVRDTNTLRPTLREEIDKALKEFYEQKSQFSPTKTGHFFTRKKKSNLEEVRDIYIRTLILLLNNLEITPSETIDNVKKIFNSILKYNNSKNAYKDFDKYIYNSDKTKTKILNLLFKPLENHIMRLDQLPITAHNEHLKKLKNLEKLEKLKELEELEELEELKKSVPNAQFSNSQKARKNLTLKIRKIRNQELNDTEGEDTQVSTEDTHVESSLDDTQEEGVYGIGSDVSSSTESDNDPYAHGGKSKTKRKTHKKRKTKRRKRKTKK
jgi:hypothetical protein